MLRAEDNVVPFVFDQPNTNQEYREESSLFNQTNYMVALGFGTACLFNRSDHNCDEIASTLEESPIEFSFDMGNWYGQGDTMGLMVLGFYGLGWARDDDRMIDTSQDMTQSLLATWAVTWALKVSINAERPNGHCYSFPSGHTSTAFAVAPVICRHYGIWAGISAYTLASITALARVEDSMHHPRDVLAGAAIGIIAGRTVSKLVPLTVVPTKRGLVPGLIYQF